MDGRKDSQDENAVGGEGKKKIKRERERKASRKNNDKVI